MSESNTERILSLGAIETDSTSTDDVIRALITDAMVDDLPYDEAVEVVIGDISAEADRLTQVEQALEAHLSEITSQE